MGAERAMTAVEAVAGLKAGTSAANTIDNTNYQGSTATWYMAPCPYCRPRCPHCGRPMPYDTGQYWPYPQPYTISWSYTGMSGAAR
jgi:hypothetical protein